MKGKSGISLIVLVITIIIITILASAVILTLSNNNPIENAKKAVDANDESIRKEASTIAYADWFLKENSGNPSGTSADEYVKIELEKQEIDTDGLFVSDDGTIITNAPSVIPNGFEYLTGTVDTGFVIKNSTDGNEFVWIPVEEGTFVRESFQNTQLNTIIYIEPYETTSYTSESAEYNAMVASVSKYGGFYMARYEASLNTSTNKAQSIANQYPLENQSWGTSMTDVTGGVVQKAREVYPENVAINEGDAISTLPYGVQWDATIRFLKSNYDGIAQNSVGYGNYNSGAIIKTGSNPSYALNNIYDLAGNLYEWTMESYNNSYRVYRGGDYNRPGNADPVACRDLVFEQGSGDDNKGFRLAIYVK